MAVGDKAGAQTNALDEDLGLGSEASPSRARSI
jgi:hypothetical protein